MKKPNPMTAALTSALALLVLSGCAQQTSSRRAGLSPAQAAECRARSEDQYRAQNRADIYKSDTYATSTRDSPFSTSGLPGITSSGLGAQYGREKALNDCYNAAGTGPVDAAPVAPAAK